MKEAYLRAQKSHARSIFEQGRTGWVFSFIGEWAAPSGTAMLGQPMTEPEQAPGLIIYPGIFDWSFFTPEERS